MAHTGLGGRSSEANGDDIYAMILTRIAELEAKVNAQAETIQAQNIKIQLVEKKYLALQARVWYPLTEFTVFPKLPKEVQDMIWRAALPGPRIIEIGTGDVPFPCPVAMVHPLGMLHRWKQNLPYQGFFEVQQRHNSVTEFPNDLSRYDRDVLDLNAYMPTKVRSRRWRNKERGSKPPALLHACHDSRAIALSIYEFCLTITPADDARFYRWPEFPSRPNINATAHLPAKHVTYPGIRFQPNADTLYIPDSSADDVEMATPKWHKCKEFRLDNIQSLALPALYLKGAPYDDLSWFWSDDDDPFRLTKLRELFLLTTAEDQLDDDNAVKVKDWLEGLWDWESSPVLYIMDTAEFLALPRWGGHTGFEHIL